MWTDEAEMKSDQRWAVIKAAFFFFCSANLIISIVLTITTVPGHIPEDNEWDMPEQNDEASDKSADPDQQQLDTEGINAQGP